MLSKKLGGEGMGRVLGANILGTSGDEQQGAKRSPVGRKSHRWYGRESCLPPSSGFFDGGKGAGRAA